MNSWLIRVAWVSLPVTAGNALAEWMRPWSGPVRALAAVMLWILWAVVLSALLVPRPVATTIARIGAPIAVAVVVLAAVSGDTSTAAWVVALAVTVGAGALAVRGEFARVCAQGAAYGDEERFPLKVPPGLAFVVLPVAIALIGVGVAAGPLLLSAEQWAPGAALVVVGWPLAFLLGRLVHQLSRRWVVLVPAGIVVADPLTLTDPVLFVRERVTGLGPADPGRRPPAEALDLRLGAAFGSCALLLGDPADLLRRARGQGVRVQAGLILVTPAGSARLLERAAARRLPVRHDGPG
jgi:hypothetical protein